MILLISGRKEARKKLGYVADFCPVCHALACFQLMAVGTGDHLYFISLGLTRTEDHIKSCMDCGVELTAKLDDYAETARNPDLLDHLIESTHPELKVRKATELEWARMIIESPQRLSGEARIEYLFQMLKLFNPQVERRYAHRFDFDGASSAGCLTTVLVVALLLQRSCTTTGESLPWRWFALWALLAGFMVTVIQVLRAPSSFMRRKVAPGVLIGAKLIQAREQEISTALKRAWSLGLLVGKKLRPQMLRLAHLKRHE